jgi:hypothetical protein
MHATVKCMTPRGGEGAGTARSDSCVGGEGCTEETFGAEYLDEFKVINYKSALGYYFRTSSSFKVGYAGFAC